MDRACKYWVPVVSLGTRTGTSAVLLLSLLYYISRHGYCDVVCDTVWSGCQRSERVVSDHNQKMVIRQWRWGLNSNHFPGRRGFKCFIPLKFIRDLHCTEADSIGGNEVPYSAPRLADGPHSALRRAVCVELKVCALHRGCCWRGNTVNRRFACLK